MIAALKTLATATGGQGQVINNWLASLPTKFGNQAASDDMKNALENFCAVASLGDNVLQDIKDLPACQEVQASKIIAFVNQITGSAVPQVWASFVESFQSGLLVNDTVFKRLVPAGDARKDFFLPTGSDKLATTDFWKGCGRHVPPGAQMQLLDKMAPFAKKEKDLDGIHKALALDSMQTVVVTYMALAKDPAEIVMGKVAQKAANLQRLSGAVVAIVAAFKQLDAKQKEDLTKPVRNYIQTEVMDNFFTFCKDLMEPLQSAVSQIPNNVESLIQGRNVQQIKGVLFKKSLVEAITGDASNLESMVALLRNSTKDWSTSTLIKSSHLAMMKDFEGKHKQLQAYMMTVHGLNIIIHKMPSAQPRERAAFNRELLGCIWQKIHSPNPF